MFFSDQQNTRRANVRAILAQTFSGNQSAFARRIKVVPETIANLTTDGPRRTRVTDRIASRIETSLGLIPGSLDTTFLPPSPSVAKVSLSKTERRAMRAVLTRARRRDAGVVKPAAAPEETSDSTAANALRALIKREKQASAEALRRMRSLQAALNVLLGRK